MQKQAHAGTPSIPSTINEKNELLQNMLANNPQLLESIQAKLGQLVGTDSGYFESLSKTVKNNVYGLKTLQEKQYKVEAEFQSELLELEKKFQKLYEPIFKLRKDIVLGNVVPTAEEIENGKKTIEEENGADDEEEDEEEEGEEEEGENESEEKGIPFFWLTAMQNLPPIADMISERDVEVLESLTNIKLEYMDKPGFKLIFEFAKNDFFSNTSIVKTYYYQKELGYTGEFVYDHAEGDDIHWSDNAHNVTVSIELRKQRNKHTKQVRTIEKTTPTYSFFNFFTPPVMPDAENDEEFEDIDEELEESLQNDYSVGELIKEKLIPRTVDWFTGHALQYEPEFQAEEEDEEFDEDEDDEDDEDDDEDDDDDENEDGAKEKPECKQQ